MSRGFLVGGRFGVVDPVNQDLEDVRHTYAGEGDVEDVECEHDHDQEGWAELHIVLMCEAEEPADHEDHGDRPDADHRAAELRPRGHLLVLERDRDVGHRDHDGRTRKELAPGLNAGAGRDLHGRVETVHENDHVHHGRNREAEHEPTTAIPNFLQGLHRISLLDHLGQYRFWKHSKDHKPNLLF